CFRGSRLAKVSLRGRGWPRRSWVRGSFIPFRRNPGKPVKERPAASCFGPWLSLLFSLPSVIAARIGRGRKEKYAQGRFGLGRERRGLHRNAWPFGDRGQLLVARRGDCCLKMLQTGDQIGDADDKALSCPVEEVS